MNECKFGGFIINDPQLSHLKDGPLLSFALECDKGTPAHLIIRVDYAGEDAQEAASELERGDAVEAHGRLRFARWINRSGVAHQTYLLAADVISREVDLADGVEGV